MLCLAQSTSDCTPLGWWRDGWPFTGGMLSLFVRRITNQTSLQQQTKTRRLNFQIPFFHKRLTMNGGASASSSASVCVFLCAQFTHLTFAYVYARTHTSWLVSCCSNGFCHPSFMKLSESDAPQIRTKKTFSHAAIHPRIGRMTKENKSDISCSAA